MKAAVILSPELSWEQVKKDLPLDIRWVVALEEGQQLSVPTYASVEEGMAAEEVDLLVDCPGAMTDSSELSVPVVSWRAAQLLLSEVKKPVVVDDSSGVISSAAQRIRKDVDKILQQMESMEGYCRRLTETGLELDSVSQGILQSLERTSTILASITRISKRSKIIGLNSSIEASRVGEKGRGFLVVAEEIKNLADDSSRSVREIERILDGIQRSSEDLSQRIGTIKDVSDSQHDSASQISALIEGLKDLGKHLEELSSDVA